MCNSPATRCSRVIVHRGSFEEVHPGIWARVLGSGRFHGGPSDVLLPLLLCSLSPVLPNLCFFLAAGSALRISWPRVTPARRRHGSGWKVENPAVQFQLTAQNDELWFKGGAGEPLAAGLSRDSDSDSNRIQPKPREGWLRQKKPKKQFMIS